EGGDFARGASESKAFRDNNDRSAAHRSSWPGSHAKQQLSERKTTAEQPPLPLSGEGWGGANAGYDSAGSASVVELALAADSPEGSLASVPDSSEDSPSTTSSVSSSSSTTSSTYSSVTGSAFWLLVLAAAADFLESALRF